MKTFLSLLITALFITTAQLSHAASFDCAKAASKVEKMICSDSALSKLDDQLAQTYEAEQAKISNQAILKKNQAAWLKVRNTCTQTACIKMVYMQRLDNLKDQQPAQYAHCVDVPGKLESGSCGQGLPGKHLAFCENYLSFLNKQAKPLSCNISIPPGFTTPNWQILEIKQHLDWAFQMEKMIPSMNISQGYSFELWKKKFLTEWKAGRIKPSMRLLRIKLPNQSEVDLLAYLRDIKTCEKYRRDGIESAFENSGYLHFILTDKKEIMPIYASPNTKKINPNIFVPDPSTSPQELLFFKGKPYFVYANSHIGISFSNVSAFLSLAGLSTENYIGQQCILIPSHVRD